MATSLKRLLVTITDGENMYLSHLSKLFPGLLGLACPGKRGVGCHLRESCPLAVVGTLGGLRKSQPFSTLWGEPLLLFPLSSLWPPRPFFFHEVLASTELFQREACVYTHTHTRHIMSTLGHCIQSQPTWGCRLGTRPCAPHRESRGGAAPSSAGHQLALCLSISQ